MKKFTLELACQDRLVSTGDIQRHIFMAVEHKIDTLAMLPSYYNLISSPYHEHLKYSYLVDFPYGTMTKEQKMSLVVKGTKLGCKYIDICINHSFYTLGKYELLKQELSACMEAASKATVRPIIDYRLFDTKDVINIAQIIREVQIEYIITSTGILADDINDNILICKEINKNTGLIPVVTGSFWKKEQISLLKDSEITRVRLNSLQSLANIFGAKNKGSGV